MVGGHHPVLCGVGGAKRCRVTWFHGRAKPARCRPHALWSLQRLNPSSLQMISRRSWRSVRADGGAWKMHRPTTLTIRCGPTSRHGKECSLVGFSWG